MSKRGRQNKTNQQIKEEQINFLLEDVEKNLDEYKRALELKEKQTYDTKKILISAKKCYDRTVAENKKLKVYIENIKQRFSQYEQGQQAQVLENQNNYYEERPQKNLKE